MTGWVSGLNRKASGYDLPDVLQTLSGHFYVGSSLVNETPASVAPLDILSVPEEGPARTS